MDSMENIRQFRKLSLQDIRQTQGENEVLEPNTNASPSSVQEFGDYKVLSNPPLVLDSEKLTWIHLRFYPPGLILEICSTLKQGKHSNPNSKITGGTYQKSIDLIDFNYNSNIKEYAAEVMRDEPFFNESNKPILISCLEKLKNSNKPDYKKQFKSKQYIKASTLPIMNADICHDGSKFATAGYDKTCKIWNTANGEELCTLSGHYDAVSHCSFNFNGDRLLTGSYDGTLRFWKISDSQHAESGGAGDLPKAISSSLLTLQGSGGEIQCCNYSGDFTLAAAGCTDSIARVYDLTTGQTLYALEGHESDVSNVQFNHGNTTLLTGSFDGKLGLWDLRSGTLVNYLVGHKEDIMKCSFDFLGEKVASCSLDKLVHLWDVRQTDVPLAVFKENTDEVWDLSFNSRGSTLASGSKDGKLILWDVRTCTPISTKPAHSGPINQVSFNPSGTLVLSCGEDSKARLWIPSTGEPYQSLEGHGRDKIIQGIFDYAGKKILTVSSNYGQIWE